MYDNATSDCRVDVDHEPPALDEISHRLANIDQKLNHALAGVNEFLSRCGKSLPPTSDAKSTPQEIRQSGHIADINSKLDDIQGLAEFLQNAARALGKIG